MTGAGIRTVAQQEFRLRIRAGRWRTLLVIWFALLLLFTILLRVAAGEVDHGRAADKGIVVYGGLVLVVLGLALLVVPALAAQSVNGDRERGTLATLQVTRLTAADIALGKFSAAWGTSLVFMLITLPLVGYAMTLGGVPLSRVLVLTVVLALLLGTVSAISLVLSALLARTTTSGVLAYLAVAGLVFGTLISFGLATALTTETYQASYENSCPTAADLPPDIDPAKRAEILSGCQPGPPQVYTASRTRTDRVWWLLAPNPFVILADAAPQLPALTKVQVAERQRQQESGQSTTDLRDVDPLGSLGRGVRSLRQPPTADQTDAGGGVAVSGSGMSVDTASAPRHDRRPVWPYGLAFDALVAAGALALTTRRLRTPSTKLPRGQRVA